MKVGMVGTGQMGMPILRRLRAAGHHVTFLARRPEVAADARSTGASPADSFPDRDLVIICVYDEAQVRAVGPTAISSMAAGSVLVNHTTCSPAAVEHLAEEAAGRDVTVLDAALSGGPADIAAGRLTLLVGGSAPVLDRVRSVLAAYSDPILAVGRVGDGQRIKLVNNALFGAQVALAVEAERVAGALGLDPVAALAAIQHCSGDSRALRLSVATGSAALLRQGAGRFIEKDLATVREVAAGLGVDLGRLGD